VSRDFRLYVSSSNYLGGPWSSVAKFVSNMASYSPRYLFEFKVSVVSMLKHKHYLVTENRNLKGVFISKKSWLPWSHCQLSNRISWRIRRHIRNSFNPLFRGPGGFNRWKTEDRKSHDTVPLIYNIDITVKLFYMLTINTCWPFGISWIDYFIIQVFGPTFARTTSLDTMT
jgi:hypothetical protein